jgi:hypothetical protein
MRKMLATIGAALAALLAVCVGGSVAVNQDERPAALATALYGPGQGEANLLVYKDGRVKEQRLTYDRDGHAQLPKWEGKAGPFGPNTVPAAPIMGWSPPYVREIANGSRPLRYCLDEVRAYDSRQNTQIAAFTPATVRALWDDLFTVTSVEDCGNPDLILGANAEQDCGSMQAYGCASFDGRRTRVTFNGTLRANGTMDDHFISCAIWGHEILHALDLGHTGQYGGEGRSHGHVSSLGFVAANGCPIDNPDGVPPIADYEDGGGGYRYQLQRRTATPNPTRTPPPAGMMQAYSWLQAGGSWRYLGEANLPTQVGRVCVVLARGGGYLTQACFDSAATAATSDRNPADVAPVGPR